MKNLLFLVFLCLAATTAQASTKKYAGNYYALVYQKFAEVPEPIMTAAMDITILDNGILTGSGGYGDLTIVSVRGKVKHSGDIILSETIDFTAPVEYRTKFSRNGKHFRLTLLDGSVMLGRKIPDAFPEAGVYSGFANDTGETALIAVQDDGNVVGCLADFRHLVTMAVGAADHRGLIAVSQEGAKIECTFSYQGIVGSYTDALGTENSFDGYKY